MRYQWPKPAKRDRVSERMKYNASTNGILQPARDRVRPELAVVAPLAGVGPVWTDPCTAMLPGMPSQLKGRYIRVVANATPESGS